MWHYCIIINFKILTIRFMNPLNHFWGFCYCEVKAKYTVNRFASCMQGQTVRAKAQSNHQ